MIVCRSNRNAKNVELPSAAYKIERVKNEVEDFAKLSSDDKVFAAPHIKKLNAVLTSKATAAKENQYELDLVDNFRKLTATQIDILHNIYDQFALHDTNVQHCIQIFADPSGQSGKSTLGRALMAHSAMGRRAKEIISSLPDVFNWMFVYLPGFAIADCTHLFNFLNELPNDEQRRFILIVDLTRSYSIPLNKIEELHKRMLRPSPYNDKRFEFLRPLQMLIFCSNHEKITSILSQQRYELHLVKPTNKQELTTISSKLGTCLNRKKIFLESISINDRAIIIFCFKFSLRDLDPFIEVPSIQLFRKKHKKFLRSGDLAKNCLLESLSKQLEAFTKYHTQLFHIPAANIGENTSEDSASRLYNRRNHITPVVEEAISEDSVSKMNKTRTYSIPIAEESVDKSARFGSELIKKYGVVPKEENHPQLEFILLNQQKRLSKTIYEESN